MKKLVLFAAVVACMGLFACGNKEQAAEAEAVDTVATAEIEVVEADTTCCGDSACCDSAVVEVAEVAAEA